MVTLEAEGTTYGKTYENVFWLHYKGKMVYINYYSGNGCLNIEYNYYVPNNTYNNKDSVKINKEEFISNVKRLLIDCGVPNTSYVLNSILKYNHVIRKTNKIKKP